MKQSRGTSDTIRGGGGRFLFPFRGDVGLIYQGNFNHDTLWLILFLNLAAINSIKENAVRRERICRNWREENRRCPERTMNLIFWLCKKGRRKRTWSNDFVESNFCLDWILVLRYIGVESQVVEAGRCGIGCQVSLLTLIGTLGLFYGRGISYLVIDLL